MSSIAAPGATGSSATSGISQPTASKRTSSNLDRDSGVYKIKEDPIWTKYIFSNYSNLLSYSQTANDVKAY